MRILIAEDEEEVAHRIRYALQEAGYAVDETHRGDDAMEMALQTNYDVIVLDIMLPGRDGLSILKTLREKSSAVPVLLLTARGETSERVEGLMLGADDYLSKPFALDELVARVHVMARRLKSEPSASLKIHDLAINSLTREVHRAGKRIDLSAREFALLDYLARNAGRVLSRTQIVERVWDYHFDTGTNVVDVYIQRLRRKIDDESEVKLLQTVRGVGYLVQTPGA